MVTKQQFTQKHGNYLRFKRWSRAKYAVFASISSCVSIGKLKASIADCLLKKQENSIIENQTIFNNTENSDSEISELEALEKFIENLKLLCIEITAGIQACKYSVSINLIIQSTKSKVDAGLFPVSTFFISNDYE